MAIALVTTLRGLIGLPRRLQLGVFVIKGDARIVKVRA